MLGATVTRSQSCIAAGASSSSRTRRNAATSADIATRVDITARKRAERRRDHRKPERDAGRGAHLLRDRGHDLNEPDRDGFTGRKNCEGDREMRSKAMRLKRIGDQPVP